MTPHERVARSESLVAGVEQLTEDGWRRLSAHAGRAKILDEYLTAKCVVDYWTYMRFGCYFGHMHHYYPPLHGSERGAKFYYSSGLAGWLQDWTKVVHGQRVRVNMKVMALNRINCKTQEGSIGYTCWRFVRDPNERILVRSCTDKKIQEIVPPIQDVLMSERHRRRFPWVRPSMQGTRPVKWACDRFTLDRDVGSVRTCSLEAYGLGANPTGGHYTARVYDDWETEDTANSAELMPQLFDKFRVDDNLGLGGHTTLVIGTPYIHCGFMDSLIKRRGEFAGVDYDLFWQPWYIEPFPEPFRGQEPVLEGDRVTVRCQGAGFPVIESNLVHCQARLTFYDPSVKDTVLELREIVWNNGESFRVNRAFPEMLGQPLQWEVPNRRTCAPHRWTMDSVDEIAPDSEKGRRLDRGSIPQMRQKQGPYIWSCQQELEPNDPANRLYGDDLLVVVDRERLPGDPDRRLWYRCLDLASKKKTLCATSILDGYHYDGGMVITHLNWGNFSLDDIYLDLFLGMMRIRRLYGAEFQWTSLEDAAFEDALQETLPKVEADPYAYFYNAGGKYRDIAEKEFRNVGRLYMRKHLVRRKNQSKGQRFLSIQPPICRRELHIVEGLPFEQRLRDEMNLARVDSDSGLDIWDTVADFIREGAPPKPERAAEDTRRNLYREVNERAALRSRVKGLLRGGWNA